MVKVLIVGFGNMGCRHAQSLLGNKDKYEIHVVEPFAEAIKTNSDRIGAEKGDITFYDSIEDAPGNFDFAIVASSSNPRYEIVKKLLNRGVKLFLLEKIVFQSAEQFDDINSLAKSKGAKLYCNFVNRFFSVYNEIKLQVGNSNTPTTMTVYGGDFGLGCNAIHYIDLFSYLTGEHDTLHLKSSEIFESEKGNKRGSIYKEFNGAISILFGDQNSLVIAADEKYEGGIVIRINSGQDEYIVSEQTQRYIKCTKEGINFENFEITPTSRLTARIIDEIINNTPRLTSLQQTNKAHVLLFNMFNENLFGASSATTICPIT